MLLESGHFRKEMSRKLHKILHEVFWVESIYPFVEGLIMSVGHFWKIRTDTYITWTKYMRRTFNCTCTDIELHHRNLHSPINPQKIVILPIISVFSPPPIKICNNWNMSSCSATDWSCKCLYWVHNFIAFIVVFVELTWKTKVRVLEYFCNRLFTKTDL